MNMLLVDFQLDADINVSREAVAQIGAQAVRPARVGVILGGFPPRFARGRNDPE
jgi:hypothetical protein